jgi:hypothetical protein
MRLHVVQQRAPCVTVRRARATPFRSICGVTAHRIRLQGQSAAVAQRILRWAGVFVQISIFPALAISACACDSICLLVSLFVPARLRRCARCGPMPCVCVCVCVCVCARESVCVCVCVWNPWCRIRWRLARRDASHLHCWSLPVARCPLPVARCMGRGVDRGQRRPSAARCARRTRAIRSECGRPSCSVAWTPLPVRTSSSQGVPRSAQHAT